VMRVMSYDEEENEHPILCSIRGIEFVLQDMAESAYILFAPPILSFGNVVEEKGFL
jgi:peroxiredoxin family protein